MNKILIIEDDPDIGKIISKRLTAEGFEVVIATDACLGVESTHKEKPNLIILDLMLPCGGGLGVLENLRLSNQTRFIPIVVLTGMQNPEYKEKVLKLGVDAYLSKPFDAAALVATIKDILAKQ